MKKSRDSMLHTMIVFLIVLCLSTSASSISSSYFNESSSSKKTISTKGADKIDDVLSFIDSNLLVEYLSTIVSYGPRLTGTYGCEKAAHYIHAQFANMGLQTRFHNWTSWGNRYYHYVFNGQNVEATLPGTDTTDRSTILFNAHFDTTAKGPGANDDGSGTVAVMAAAYALSHFTFKRTLKFIAFSGEEIALIGSRAYAKEAYTQNQSILVEINADMIGHDEGSNTISVTATEDAGWVADIFQTINSTYSIGLRINRGDINRVGHTMSGSDYAPFLAYGWEAIGCWEGDHDPNFHTAQDNLTNVNMSYLVNMTRIIAGTLAYLADLEETPPQVRITSPEIGYLYNVGLKMREIGEFKTTVINNIWIWAEVAYASVPIERAEFYYDGRLLHTDTEAPYTWQFNEISIGKHDVTVFVYDQLGRNSSDWREIRFINILKKIK